MGRWAGKKDISKPLTQKEGGKSTKLNFWVGGRDEAFRTTQRSLKALAHKLTKRFSGSRLWCRPQLHLSRARALRGALGPDLFLEPRSCKSEGNPRHTGQTFSFHGDEMHSVNFLKKVFLIQQRLNSGWATCAPGPCCISAENMCIHFPGIWFVIDAKSFNNEHVLILIDPFKVNGFCVQKELSTRVWEGSQEADSDIITMSFGPRTPSHDALDT